MNESRKPLALDIAQKIDQTCDEFEAAWQSGLKPRIEDYLSSVAPQHIDDLLRSLLRVELELLKREGDVASEDSIKARFSEHSQVVDEVLESVYRRAADEITRKEERQPPENTLSLRDASIDTSKLQRSGDGKPNDNSLQKIGRFQIIEAVGKGAFGTVYRAYDPQLDREVALKLPRAGVLETQDDVERFLREARSAATLRHSHICPIYDFGKIGDDYFIVMAYISGKPLSSVLSKSKDISSRKIAVAVRKIAIALAAAHNQDVIHRDLKPSNIMIDQQGEPVLMDFGLARRVSDEEAQLTHSGAILGTPAYMSPEQARGMSKAVGATSDIYSLGVILYELLCGQRPFKGSVAEVMSAVLRDEPKPPSAYKSDVDPELEKICLKAIAKKPEERYQSMEDFAEALAEYLRARRAAKAAGGSAAQETAAVKSEMEKLSKGGEKKSKFAAPPKRAAKSADGFDPYHKWLGIAPEEQPASHYRLLGLNQFETDADVIEAAAERQMAYLHQINAGPHLAASQQLLNELAVAKLCLLNPKKKAAYDESLHEELAPSETDDDISINSEDELEAFAELPTFPQRKRVASSGSAWWKDLDRRVLIAGAAGLVGLLGVVIITIKIKINTDGSRPEVTATTPQVPDTPDSPTELPEPVGQQLLVFNAAKERLPELNGWAFDDEQIALGTAKIENGILVHDARGRASSFWTTSLPAPDIPRDAVLYMQAAAKIVAESNTWTQAGVTLLELGRETKEKTTTVRLCGQKDRVFILNRYDKKIASVFMDTTDDFHTYRLGLDGNKLQLHIDGVLKSEVESVDILAATRNFEPEAQIFARFGDNSRQWSESVTHWKWVIVGAIPPVDKENVYPGPEHSNQENLDTDGQPQELHRLQVVGANTDTYDLAFTPDGKKLITGNTDEHLRVWDVESGQLISSIKTPRSGRAIAVSPNGRDVAYGGVAGKAIIWEIETGKQKRQLRSKFAGSGVIMGIDYSPDGKWIAASCLDGYGRIWEPDSGRELHKFVIKAPKNGGCSINFTPDGSRLLVKGRSRILQVFDAHTGALESEFDLGSESAGGPRLAISPDGQRFVTCNFRARALVFDLKTGKKLGEGERGHADVSSVQFSPNGRWIVAGHHLGSVQLLDARTRKQLFMLQHERACVASLAFSPDGRFLASATRQFTPDQFTGGDIRIWRMPNVGETSPNDNRQSIEPNSVVVQRNRLNDPQPEYAHLLTGKWEPGLQLVDDFKTHPEMSLNDGVIELNGHSTLTIGKQPFRDGIIRAKVKILGGRHPHIRLRKSTTLDGYYAICHRMRNFKITKHVLGTDWETLAAFTANSEYTDYFEWALAAVGDEITVYVDGKKVLDIRDNSFREGLPAIGGLDCHALFRDVEIMKLDNRGTTSANPIKKGDGFESLFNGKDLQGWTGDTSRFAVVNGNLVTLPGERGNLFTEKKYSDFTLRFDFKLTSGSNSGIGLRAPTYGNPSSDGLEIQIIDESAYLGKGLKPFQFHGSVYGVLPAQPGALKEVGAWNSQEITIQGTKIKVILNGKTILDGDLAPFQTQRDLPDGKGHPGLRATNGRIALQNCDGRVEFRNIRIREFEKEKNPVTHANKNSPEGWTTDNSNLWSMNDDVLTARAPEGDSQWITLTSDEDYGDYKLDFEYRLSKGSRAKVFLHFDRQNPPPPEDRYVQVQLLDNNGAFLFEGDKKRRPPPQFRNAAVYFYTRVHRSPGYRIEERDGLPTGEWNRMSIVTKGLHVTVTLNGAKVAETQVDQTAKFRHFMNRKEANTYQPLKSTHGAIQFRVVDKVVEFRNIRVQEIDSESSTQQSDPPDSGASLYNASTGRLPQQAGWSFHQENNDDAQAVLSANFLSHDSGKDGVGYWAKTVPLRAPQSDDGIYMETAARVVKETHQSTSAGVTLLSLSAPTQAGGITAQLTAHEDRVMLQNDQQQTLSTISMATTDGAHEYRLECSEDMYWLFIDGKLKDYQVTTKLRTTKPQSNAADKLSARFGDTSEASTSHTEYQSIDFGELSFQGGPTVLRNIDDFENPEDSANKNPLVKVYKPAAGFWPEETGWVFENQEGETKLDGGTLHHESKMQSRSYWWNTLPAHSVPADSGVFMQIAAQIEQEKHVNQRRGYILMEIDEITEQFHRGATLYAWEDKLFVIGSNDWATLATVEMDTTNAKHTYRLEIQKDYFWLYINGTLRAKGKMPSRKRTQQTIDEMPSESTSLPRLFGKFGDNSVSAESSVAIHSVVFGSLAARGGPTANQAKTDYDHLLTGYWQFPVMSQKDVPNWDDVKVDQGAFEVNSSSVLDLVIGSRPYRNLILRADVEKRSGWHPGIELRKNDLGSYCAYLDKTDLFGLGMQFSGWKDLHKRTRANHKPGYFEWAVAVYENRLMIYVDGQKVIQSEDDTHKLGLPCLHINKSVARFRNLQIMELPEGSLPLARIDTPPRNNFSPTKPDPQPNSMSVSDAAKWVLDHGGEIRIRDKDKQWGKTTSLKQGDRFPTKPYRVVFVELRKDAPSQPVDLTHISPLKELEHIGLNDVQIAPNSLEALVGMNRLDRLYLSRTGINDRSLESIGQLEKLSQLHVPGTSITDEGVSHLAKLQNLKVLHLNQTATTDKGLSFVGRLKNMARLNLDDTRITDSGMTHISKLTKMETLLLARTDVSDEGLKRLRTLKSLKQIDLAGTKVTAGGIAAFKKSVPDCFIRHDVSEPTANP